MGGFEEYKKICAYILPIPSPESILESIFGYNTFKPPLTYPMPAVFIDSSYSPKEYWTNMEATSTDF
jgi:hypothetical protein